jgi:hypothetical protein
MRSNDNHYLWNFKNMTNLINWDDPNLTVGDHSIGHKVSVLRVSKDPERDWLTSLGRDSTLSISGSEVIDQLWDLPKSIELPRAKALRPDGLFDHYKRLAWGLHHLDLPDSPEKNELRQDLYGKDDGTLKIFVDYSVAKREFARQIYNYSELAQRAKGEYGLWFCMESAECLQKLLPDKPYTAKEAIQCSSTDWIKSHRAKLKAAVVGDPVNLLTLEALLKPDSFDWQTYNAELAPRVKVKDTTVKQLKSGDIDWRFFIIDLLVNEAIAIVAQADGDSGKDLVHHIRQFLNAFEHFNSMTLKNSRRTQIFKKRQPM